MIFEWMGNGNKWFLTILWLVYGLLAALIVTIATEIKPKFVFFCQVRVLEEEKEIDGFPDDARGWSKIQWWNHFISIWIDSFNGNSLTQISVLFPQKQKLGKKIKQTHIPTYTEWQQHVFLSKVEIVYLAYCWEKSF